MQGKRVTAAASRSTTSSVPALQALDVINFVRDRARRDKVEMVPHYMDALCGRYGTLSPPDMLRVALRGMCCTLFWQVRHFMAFGAITNRYLSSKPHAGYHLSPHVRCMVNLYLGCYHWYSKDGVSAMMSWRTAMDEVGGDKQLRDHIIEIAVGGDVRLMHYLCDIDALARTTMEEVYQVLRAGVRLRRRRARRGRGARLRRMLRPRDTGGLLLGALLMYEQLPCPFEGQTVETAAREHLAVYGEDGQEFDASLAIGVEEVESLYNIVFNPVTRRFSRKEPHINTNQVGG